MHFETAYTKLPSSLDDTSPQDVSQHSKWMSKIRRHWSHIILLCVVFLLAVWIVVLSGGKLLSSHSTHVISPNACSERRLRQEWRTLSVEQRTSYIQAVQCTSTLPSNIIDNGTVYDDYPWVHSLMAENKETEHRKPNFLPFHRYLLHTYEQTLQRHCGYDGALPYWDWTLDWTNMTLSPIWDSDTGFGGDGQPGGEIVHDHGRCLHSGPFVSLKPLYHERKYNPHCLSRGFRTGQRSGKVFPASELRPQKINDILLANDYDEMCQGLEMGPHNFIPFSIRGDFFSFSSPYDPLFFLHHAQIDRLWWIWQQRGAERVNQYGENGTLKDVLNMHGLNVNRQVKEVMSSESELMCYGYS